MAKFTALIERTQAAELVVEADSYWAAVDVVEFMLAQINEDDLELTEGWTTIPNGLELAMLNEEYESHSTSVSDRYHDLTSGNLTQEEEEAFWAGYELALSEFAAHERKAEFGLDIESLDAPDSIIEEPVETEEETDVDADELAPVAG